MTDRLRLLIADREATRVGIRMALDGDVEICAEVDDAEQAIRAAKREQPDVCLVGDDLAGSGIAAVRGICRAAPDAAVVVLTEVHDVDLLLDCVRAGAVGYVPGALDAERLRRIVRAAGEREAVVPRSMVLELLLELRGRGNGADALTTRESQVLGMLRRGHSTAEIADRLVIAPVTVRRHISELVRKLGVEGRCRAGHRRRARSARRRRLDGPEPRAPDLNASRPLSSLWPAASAGTMSRIQPCTILAITYRLSIESRRHSKRAAERWSRSSRSTPVRLTVSATSTGRKARRAGHRFSARGDRGASLGSEQRLVALSRSGSC